MTSTATNFLRPFNEDETMMPSLLIGITFHFVEERLARLRKIASYFSKLSRNTKVFVVTNTESINDHREILANMGPEIEIYVPKLLGHPYLLTWAHLDIFREFFQRDQNITHFMYLEDDILIKPNNLEYWLKGREDLRQFGLIPSFLRYEFIDHDPEMRCTDVASPVEFFKMARVEIVNGNYCYINLTKPYQGMYLLDRELAREHLFGPSASPDFGCWGIREKAAQGLTFANVPSGCRSRNFIGFIAGENRIDPNALIHHTPNNYANNPNTRFGKLPVRKLVRSSLIFSNRLMDLVYPAFRRRVETKTVSSPAECLQKR